MANKQNKSANAAAKVRAAQQQKRQRMQWSIGIILLVVVGIGVLVLAKVSQNGSSVVKTGAKPVAAASSITADLAKVPLSAIASAHTTRRKGDPKFTDLAATAGKPLTSAGKPEVLYMGAQYCPYCGGERWALAVALSKFGTFSDLKMMTSAEGNIPTLSFESAKFTSKYLAFTPIELQDQQGKPLEKATDAQMAMLKANGGSYPFINFGGSYIQSGASLDVQVLVGEKQTDIAKSLSKTGDLQSVPTQVNSAAGSFIKAICSLTKGQPGDVCKAFPAK